MLNLHPRHVNPMPEHMLSIHTHEDHLAIPVPEFLETVLESEDFGRAHEGEGGGDEEKDEPGRVGGVGADVGGEGDFCWVDVRERWLDMRARSGGEDADKCSGYLPSMTPLLTALQWKSGAWWPTRTLPSWLILLLSLGPLAVDIVRVRRRLRKFTRVSHSPSGFYKLEGSDFTWIERICRPGVWLWGAGVRTFRADVYWVSSSSYQSLHA